MSGKITALKVQKKDPTRINVYLDGEFAFGIDRLVGAWLSVGQELNEAKKDDLLKADVKEKAYKRALNFLDYRIRSEAEIRQRLQKAGFEEDVINLVVTRLKESGLAGDQIFARSWVENRSSFRPRSRRMLYAELRQKGVEDSIISQALENAPDETELARTLGQKYANRLREAGKVIFCKKMTEYLLRKGFDYAVARDITMQLWSERTEESDNPLKQLNKENDNV